MESPAPVPAEGWQQPESLEPEDPTLVARTMQRQEEGSCCGHLFPAPAALVAGLAQDIWTIPLLIMTKPRTRASLRPCLSVKILAGFPSVDLTMNSDITHCELGLSGEERSPHPPPGEENHL